MLVMLVIGDDIWAVGCLTVLVVLGVLALVGLLLGGIGILISLMF